MGNDVVRVRTLLSTCSPGNAKRTTTTNCHNKRMLSDIKGKIASELHKPASSRRDTEGTERQASLTSCRV